MKEEIKTLERIIRGFSTSLKSVRGNGDAKLILLNVEGRKNLLLREAMKLLYTMDIQSNTIASYNTKKKSPDGQYLIDIAINMLEDGVKVLDILNRPFNLVKLENDNLIEVETNFTNLLRTSEKYSSYFERYQQMEKSYRESLTLYKASSRGFKILELPRYVETLQIQKPIENEPRKKNYYIKRRSIKKSASSSNSNV